MIIKMSSIIDLSTTFSMIDFGRHARGPDLLEQLDAILTPVWIAKGANRKRAKIAIH